MRTALAIPAELTSRRQWIIWRFGARGDGKPTKLPHNPRTGRMASSTDPGDWFSYDEAVESSHPRDGVGFVFVKGGGMVGIDLDNCIDDCDAIKPWADKIIRAFATYAEISPSGRGVKMWAKGKLPGERGTRKAYEDGEIEMYDWGRFFTVTGRKLECCPATVAEQQRYIDLLHSKLSPKPQQAAAAPPVELADQAIVEKLLSEPNHKAARLWSGNASDYTSESEADMALVSKIAFYTQDTGQIERLFGMSGLVRPKWRERADYRTATIDRAIQQGGERYSPPASASATERPKPEPVKLAAPADASGLGLLLEATIDGKRRNVAWPWRDLSYHARALLPGTLTVLCGGAGSTKSMMVSQSCLYWQTVDVPFAVFHLEEDREFHLHRALAQLEHRSSLTDDEYIRDNPDEAILAYDRHRATLDRLSSCIWDAPTTDIEIENLTDWAAERATEGRRIIVIDPVTAADSGREPWRADRQFVLQCKRIMRESGASLIVVTHPRDGNPRHGDHLDNIAGGRAYNRFTQTVLLLESLAQPELRNVSRMYDFQNVMVNRIVAIRKARNGSGAGKKIGFYFDPETLLSGEQGVLGDDD